jgi:hypothetical protein
MKRLLLIPLAFLCFSCTPEQQAQAIAMTGSLAGDAVKAAATYYGGPAAGELASAGLSAAAEVLQGYVDKKPPLQVIEKSPGVAGVGQVVVNYLKTKGIVTQATVDKIHTAAVVAANATR